MRRNGGEEAIWRRYSVVAALASENRKTFLSMAKKENPEEAGAEKAINHRRRKQQTLVNALRKELCGESNFASPQTAEAASAPKMATGSRS